ncbi:MAG: hypothetical protein GY797_00655 [Deltaproteobacteria bacterium]|nr:hypothetical protein [Deltaproteobacteria bacterium]
MDELTVVKNGVEYLTVQWVQHELNMPTDKDYGDKYVRSELRADPDYYGAQKEGGRWLIHPNKVDLILEVAGVNWRLAGGK